MLFFSFIIHVLHHHQYPRSEWVALLTVLGCWLVMHKTKTMTLKASCKNTTSKRKCRPLESTIHHLFQKTTILLLPPICHLWSGTKMQFWNIWLISIKIELKSHHQKLPFMVSFSFSSSLITPSNASFSNFWAENFVNWMWAPTYFRPQSFVCDTGRDKNRTKVFHFFKFLNKVSNCFWTLFWWKFVQSFSLYFAF